MKITLSGIKTFDSPDGGGFNATLLFDGKKVATVHDGGHGGEVELYPISTSKVSFAEVRDILKAEAAKLPPFKYDDGTELTQDYGDLIVGLVSAWEQQKEDKRLQKLCQTKILFRLKGDRADQLRTIIAPWNDTTKTYMRTHYGDKIESILNEKYAA